MTVEKLVSPFIPQQFPEFYHEEGPNFIAFVKAYYEWLELEENALGASRRLLEYADVDETLDRFLTHFKNEYMIGFPDETAADKRLLLKHVLDLYRVKGTKRGVELLFRILFNEDVEVFEPWRYVFSPSAAEWYVPKYLEVSGSPYLWQLEGKKISSSRAGTTAVVEQVYRRIVAGQNVYVLVLSHLVGRFHRSEYVLCDDIPEMTVDSAPSVLGSLSTVSILSGGAGYSVGDILEVEGTGYGGFVKVLTTKRQGGELSFELLDGGSGYTMNAVVTVVGDGAGGDFHVGGIKDREIVLINSDLLSDYLNKQLDQDSAGYFVHVTSISGAFTVGEHVWSSAVVLPLDVTPISGSLQLGEDVTGSGVAGVIAVTDESLVSLVSNTGTFTEGLVLTGSTSGANVSINYVFPTETVEANGYLNAVNSTVLTVTNVSSFSSTFRFISNVNVTTPGSGYSNSDYVTFSGSGSGGYALVTTSNTGAIVQVDLRDSGTGWTSAPSWPGGFTIHTSGGSSAALTANAALAGGYFIHGSTVTGLSSSKTAVVNTVSRQTNWSFPVDGSTNLDSRIDMTLTSYGLEVGTISRLDHINPGGNYTTDPTVTVVEEDIASIGIPDGRGGYKGDNAVVVTRGGYANGVVTAVSIVDSGLGYQPGESLTLYGADNPTVIYGRAVISLSGVGTGYWKNNRSFLNSNQRIQDSYYYQRFSYEVVAPRMLKTYQEFMRQLVHPTGFALFGRYSVTDVKENQVSLIESSVAQS